ncbi:MAG: hypothetical protein M0P31_15705 [Solirubrobacteraceae bacterium]|nr:hypothetical protein [Solirubrobacteraceae bacterium]
MTSRRSPYAGLAGRWLPGGAVDLGPHVAWLWSHCIGEEPVAGEADPTVGWLLAMRGLGVPLEGLFALVDADADSGVVLGEAELVLERAPRVGERLRSTVAIEEVVRKHGARSGTFDVMRLRIDLHDATDERVVTLVNRLVFPRGDDRGR